MNTSEREYEDAWRNGSFFEAESAFQSLPYTVRRNELGFGVAVEVKNDLLDRIVSLFGEGTKGPWRASRQGRTLVYGWDEYIRVRPGLTDEELKILKDLGIVLDKNYVPPVDLR